MSPDRSIAIQVDDRIRLLAAALALTDWPQREQANKPHGVHPHAKATQRLLADAAHHEAVRSLQALLDADHAPEELLGAAVYLGWPESSASGSLPEWLPAQWMAQLHDFYHAGKLQDFWHSEDAAWKQAAAEARQALPPDLDMLGLCGEFFGPRRERLIFQPNLCYPTDQTIGFRRGDELVCVAPPRIAWGDNPPWPYDDDPAWTYATVFGAYVHLLLREHLNAHPQELEAAQSDSLPLPPDFQRQYPGWLDQFAVIFADAATGIFLAQALGKAEADSFILMEHKAHGFAILTGAIRALETYLTDHKAGRVRGFADFLPTFCERLLMSERPGK